MPCTVENDTPKTALGSKLTPMVLKILTMGKEATKNQENKGTEAAGKVAMVLLLTEMVIPIETMNV